MMYVVVMVVGIALGAGCCAIGVLEFQRRLRNAQATLETRERRVVEQNESLKVKLAEANRLEQEIRAKLVSYQELEAENRVVKRDLHAVAIHMNKLRIDGRDRDEHWKEL